MDDRWRTRDWRDRDEHYNEDRGEDRYFRGGQYRGGDEYGSYGGYEAYDRGQARGSDRGFAQDYDRDRGYYGRDRDERERVYFDRGNYGAQRDVYRREIRPVYAGGDYRGDHRNDNYRSEPYPRSRPRYDSDRGPVMRSDAGPQWERTVGHDFELDREDLRRDGWRGRGGSDREQRDREYGRDYWDDYPWSARRW